MPGATAPDRDSSLADLIGPGDHGVPDGPRSGLRLSAGGEKIESEPARVTADRISDGLGPLSLPKCRRRFGVVSAAQKAY